MRLLILLAFLFISCSSNGKKCYTVVDETNGKYYTSCSNEEYDIPDFPYIPGGGY